MTNIVAIQGVSVIVTGYLACLGTEWMWCAREMALNMVTLVMEVAMSRNKLWGKRPVCNFDEKMC